MPERRGRAGQPGLGPAGLPPRLWPSHVRPAPRGHALRGAPTSGLGGGLGAPLMCPLLPAGIQEARRLGREEGLATAGASAGRAETRPATRPETAFLAAPGAPRGRSGAQARPLSTPHPAVAPRPPLRSGSGKGGPGFLLHGLPFPAPLNQGLRLAGDPVPVPREDGRKQTLRSVCRQKASACRTGPSTFRTRLHLGGAGGRGGRDREPRLIPETEQLRGPGHRHDPAKQVVSGLLEDNRRLSTGENGAESCQRTAWPELPSRSPRRGSRSAAVALRRPGPGFPEAERGAGGGQERSKAARPSPPAAPPRRPPRIVRCHPRPPRRLLRSTGSAGAPLPGPGHLGGGKGEGESPDHACDVLRDRPQPRVRGRHEAGGGARGGPGSGEATRAGCWRKSAKIHVSRPLRQLPAAPDTAALKPARRSPRSPSVTTVSQASPTDTPWSKPGRGGREAPALQDSESAFKASPPPHPPPNQLARELSQASLNTKQTGASAKGRESPARSKASLARPARPVEPSSVRRQEEATPPLHL
nr:uncharacterized protein LOC110150009 [Odocoileus virginianus texanus]